MKGKGELRLTGQLGDVMKESAQAAMSYLRGHAAQLGIADSAFRNHDVHVHVPAGATPKDGPSAGVAMLVALASLFTGGGESRAIWASRRADVAGVGAAGGWHQEQSLGGTPSRAQASPHASKEREGSRRDSGEARRGLEFVFIDRVEEALEHALTSPPPAPRKAAIKPAPRRKKKAPRRRPAGMG